MKKLLLSFLILLIFCHFVSATHLRAGFISYEKVSGLTYAITVYVFTDTGSEVKFGDGFLDFGDASQHVQLPQIDNNISEELGPDVAYARYTTRHTFPSSGDYLISYVEPNRNEGILNIDNSVNTTFYIETFLVIDPLSAPNHNSPIPFSPPIFRHNYNDDLSLSLAAEDINNWRLRYDFVVPKKEINNYVDGYEMPKGIKLDSICGLMTWSREDILSQAHLGEYGFAIQISQYQLVEGEYRLNGYMIYDFQVILEEMQGLISIGNGSSASMYSEDVFQISPLESDTIRYNINASDGEVFAKVFSQLTSDNLDWKVVGAGSKKQVELVIDVSEDMNRSTPHIITIRAFMENGSNTHDHNLRIYTQEVVEPDIIITSLPNPTASEKVKVFPNPSTNQIYFRGLKKPEKYKVFTSSGQLILAGKAINHIDVAHLNAGQYILVIGENSFLITKK